MARSVKRGSGQGQLRIIGGQWRGRKLNFTPAEGLRPTSDRIRETLFNWLTTRVPSARCADLFAGSGALGLEALSRGAAHCDFVDTSNTALDQIGEHLTTLQAAALAHRHTGTAGQFLESARTAYDIVFVDPPFDRQLVAPVCALLDEKQLLSPGATIYIEMGAAESDPNVPNTWALHREKVSGGVAYRLYRSPALST